MINKALKFFIVLYFPLIGVTQNLIPNYSFEDTALRVTPLYLPADWTAANLEGWEYFTPHQKQFRPLFSVPNNIAGTQVAKTGSAYAGLYLYGLYSSIRDGIREYLQVKLRQPLMFDSTYCFQLYISLGDTFQYASKNMIGVYFSSNQVYGNYSHHLPYIPQLVVSPNTFITDKINWVKIDMQYKAQGGEEYITIGNFNDTNYIDTTFVAGGGNQFWAASSFYYLDDIWLSSCDSLPESLITAVNEPFLKQKFKVYPNPFQEQITVHYEGNENLVYQLFNSLGQEVAVQIQSFNHRTLLSVGNLPKGLYWLRVSDGEQEETFKLVKR